MSSENVDQLSKLAELSLENVREPRKLPSYSYTKEFLLSLKDLDTCKKLPSGIDESILSELEQASNSSYEQNRFQGGGYQQSSRRNEYGPGQSNRLESSSSYARGNQGKWDTRSSESSDKEEAQADRDAVTQEPGKRYPNQPRRSWQHSEHDGLLGRPLGYSGNTSQRARGGAQLPLSKSNEPYQPPRPYKAPFSRREKSDTVNDETFGSSECPTQDQAEEEKRRRELFELMRKEQQQAREKAQKENSNNKKDADGAIDVMRVNIEHSGAVKVKNSDDGLGFLQGDSKIVSHSQQSSARPLVPPGFRNPVVDKNPAQTFSEATSSSETVRAGACDSSNLKDGSMERVDNKLESGNRSTSDVCTVDLKIISEDVSLPLESVNEKEKASSPSQEFSDLSSFLVSGLQQPPELMIDDSLTGGLTNEKSVETATNVMFNQDKSTSILDKLFKNANRVNDGCSSDHVEDHVVDEETWSPTSSQSSKFSRWFLEEKTAPPEDIPLKGLHSLFSHSDKFESLDSRFDKMMVTEGNPSLSTVESNSAMDTSLIPNVDSSTTSTQETFYPADKPTISPCVLTCEDLEQYILAEANVNSSSVPPLASESGSIIENAEPQKADVNNVASQHLLSLLQKGGSKESDARLFSTDFDTVKSAEECVSSDNPHVTERSLTLETLFGPSFMKELHSVAAPLSGSVGGTARTSSHSIDVVENPFFSMARGPTFDAISEENLPNTKHQRKDHRFHEPWQEFEVSQLERSISAHTSNIADRPAEVQLPEEESLIILGDSVNRAGLEPFSVDKVNHEEFSFKTSNNVDGNLSILNTIFNSKRTPSQHGVGGSLSNVAYDIADTGSSHQQLFRGPSLFPNQSSQATPAFQQLGSHPHRNPQIRFMASDTIHQDVHHRFTTGMIPQQSHQTLATQFDPSGHLSISHNMPSAGNFPPHHLQFPRGVSPSPSNQIPTYFPEGNSMHGFPLNLQRPPSYGVGMGLPGPGMGNGLGQQETLEWIRAMEMRARSKQPHTVGNSHLPGMYGAELDMGFRYR